LVGAGMSPFTCEQARILKVKTINTGRGGPRLKLAVIEGTLLQHANEVYGYMCVYLRLKSIVPPSSDRNER
jgi:hypothetical protein